MMMMTVRNRNKTESRTKNRRLHTFAKRSALIGMNNATPEYASLTNDFFTLAWTSCSTSHCTGDSNPGIRQVCLHDSKLQLLVLRDDRNNFYLTIGYTTIVLSIMTAIICMTIPLYFGSQFESAGEELIVMGYLREASPTACAIGYASIDLEYYRL